MNGPTVEYGAAADQTTADWLGLTDRKDKRDSTVTRDFPHDVALDAIDLSILRVAKARRVFRNCIQHRLDIRGRAGNHAQDLTRRRLLLQRLSKFSEQPHVLDGSRSLPLQRFG